MPDGVIEEINARRWADERQRLAAAVFEAAQEAILVTDAAKNHCRQPGLYPSLAMPKPRCRGEPRACCGPNANRTPISKRCGRPSGTRVFGRASSGRREDGERRVALANLGAIGTADQITHYVGIATDITAQKAVEQHIEHLAYYDALTALPNRRCWPSGRNWPWPWRRAGARPWRCCFSTWIGSRRSTIRSATPRATPCWCRWRTGSSAHPGGGYGAQLGGDEFVLLLPEAGQEGALRVADKVQAAFQQPFAVAGHCR